MTCQAMWVDRWLLLQQRTASGALSYPHAGSRTRFAQPGCTTTDFPSHEPWLSRSFFPLPEKRPLHRYIVRWSQSAGVHSNEQLPGEPEYACCRRKLHNQCQLRPRPERLLHRGRCKGCKPCRACNRRGHADSGCERHDNGGRC